MERLSNTTGIEGEAELTFEAGRFAGLLWGGLGVLAFSLTFPATRVAVLGGLDSAFVGLGRGAVAGILAGAVLLLGRAPLPRARLWPRLAVVAIGVVIGFPLFSSLALGSVSSAHGAVITGLLPAATAIMAVLRAGERPSRLFWTAVAIGLVSVLVFAAVQGAGRPQAADMLILLAVALAALGYAEGGALARELGGGQVICWALLLSLPVTGPMTVIMLAQQDAAAASPQAWAGFAYVSGVSMFLGFFAWYRGLSLGGVARVGQLQLAQPVLTLAWSGLLLRETIGLNTMLAAGVVLMSVALTQAAPMRRARPAAQTAT